MIVQIYEIQTPQEAEQCIEAGVDHIGSVILREEEWQKPEIRYTVSVSSGTDVKNSIIPLFGNLDNICRSVDYYEPDFIHFCDSLTDDQGTAIDLDRFISLQKDVKKRFPEVSIIRSIPIPVNGKGNEFPTLELAQEFEPFTDLFLTDTWLGKEPVEGFIGITGKLCDPGQAKDLVFQSGIPVILAGGLSPENVYESAMDIRPAGVDSCTLTNKQDDKGNPIRFKKDFSKVREFAGEAKRAQREISEKEREVLLEEIEELKEQLRDREKALPAHSVRPNQLMVIEELEDQIEEKEEELIRIK